MTGRPQNPLHKINWRWWAAFPLTLVIATIFAVLVVIKTAGKVAEYYGDILHVNALRPLIRWTWGGQYND